MKLIPQSWKMRTLLATALLLTLAVGAFFVLFTPDVAVVPSLETTHITEPLRPDGYVDYAAALDARLAAGATQENNAAVVLWQLYGPRASEDAPWRTTLRYRLDLPPWLPEDHYFVKFDDFHEQHSSTEVVADDAYWDAIRRCERLPWTQEEFPALAAWLDAEQNRLDQVVEATRRPTFYSPYEFNENRELISALLHHAYMVQNLAGALHTRAMLRVSEGEVASAWTDLAAVARLCRLFKTDAVASSELLVWIRLTEDNMQATAALLRQAGLPRSLLDKIHTDYESLPLLSRNNWDGERWLLLDAYRVMQNEEDVANRVQLLGRYFHSIDWNIPFRRTNEWFDRLEAAAGAGDLQQQQQAWDKCWAEFETWQAEAKAAFRQNIFSREARSEMHASIFVGHMLPDLLIINRTIARHNTRLDLLRVEIALAEYRADQGAYPPALDVLEPGYLAELPVDHFTGSPFEYIVRDGEFLLYSRGENGIDDEGIFAATLSLSGHREGPDDILLFHPWPEDQQ